jgi:hypothetical protein
MRYLLSLLGLDSQDSEAVAYKSPKPEIVWVIMNYKYLGRNHA